MSAPKYPKPNILLIDMLSEAQHLLENEGHNVAAGSFGTPYKVVKSDEYAPVIANGVLPNFAEQEVVVVDLVPSEDLDGPPGPKTVSDGESDLWASCSRGVIDPRPLFAHAVKDKANKIYSNGGLFVVFTSARYLQRQFLGRKRGYHPQKEQDFPFDDWSFLSDLNQVVVQEEHGREISMSAQINVRTPLGKLLSTYINGAEFVCTMRPKPSIRDRSHVLAENKYQEPVAVAISSGRSSKGVVLLLPQIEDKARFLASLLKNVAPDLMPHLFPHAEGARWIQRPDYEVPSIQGLKDQVRRVEEEARIKVAELNDNIEAERGRMSYIHDLVRGNDRTLVLAVKKALEAMGFERVVDVDEAIEESDAAVRRREDLQVWDQSPVLLIEIKGIVGMPSDEDSTAVLKYLLPRAKEWTRTDLKGLTIINHQRHIPGLDRDNQNAFREDVVTNAEEQDLGLLSAWDLFRLLRGYLRNNWQPEQIQPLFYRSGRISPLPIHYELVGVIEGFIEKKGVVGIKIMGDTLRCGDRIAFELPIEFYEQEIVSLQVNNQSVREVSSGAMVGTLTDLTKEKAKRGTRVFRLA